MVHYLFTSKSVVKEKQIKQTTMDIFLKGFKPAQEESQEVFQKKVLSS